MLRTCNVFISSIDYSLGAFATSEPSCEQSSLDLQAELITLIFDVSLKESKPHQAYGVHFRSLEWDIADARGVSAL